VSCADQSQKEDPAVFQLVKGSVDEVKLKGHELCLKLTSTQNGEKVLFLSFTNAKDYEHWLRRCKKVALPKSELNFENNFFKSYLRLSLTVERASISYISGN